MRYQKCLAATDAHGRSLNVATVPIRAVLNRLSDPAFLASVESVPVWSLLRDSLRSVQILPALINAEREALGLHTVEVAVENRRFERAIAESHRQRPGDDESGGSTVHRRFV